ncbi:aromatic-ring-hydroxylating dioxygenase subunit beta [Achromobacter aegrifaciens]|uniref:3-phenylpropionate dioxygenase subunit beta n=1 Tax=Achromobacter aegrifaciens TaxID=1287736 RepID=A0AAD2J4K9_ACHAE|nr:aromatic-ring-hydroxylating dioxygenase subunit beta [Achromobacter aegrifaciens]CUJ68947.1 3-phenylpropionate dioxygenase subunit beta [Achromobacter aegrifaciens]
MELEKSIRELLAQLCLHLDKTDYKRYLELCDPAFEYRISVFSPEIRRDMVWLEKDKESMRAMIDLLPKQNMDSTPLTRHFSICNVSGTEDGDVHRVRSTLQVFRTEHEGGETSLVAIGEYLDKVRITQGGPLLLDREVRLHTRMLGKGYHVPF